MAQKQLNHGLHLVRGICALGVAGYHYLTWTHDIKIESVGAFYVYIFFILSAVTMLIVHEPIFPLASNARNCSHSTTSGAPVSSLCWLWSRSSARSFRLLRDGHWDLAALAGSFARTYLTATTLFGFQMPGLISGTVAAWSLGIEAVFYVIFPIAVVLLGRGTGLRGLLVALVVLVVGQQSVLVLIHDQTSPIFWFRYANPLVFAPFFLLGMIVYRYPVHPSRQQIWWTLAQLLGIAMFSVLLDVDLYRAPWAYLLLGALATGVVGSARAADLPAFALPVARFHGGTSATRSI